MSKKKRKAKKSKRTVETALSVPAGVDYSATFKAQNMGTYTSSQGVQGSELYEWLTGMTTSYASVADQRTARESSAVHASLSIIGGAIAQLPIGIYQRSGGDRQRIWDHPLNSLLTRQFAPAWTPSAAKRHSMISILLRGDGFIWIQRKGSNPDPYGLEPLHPDSVTVERSGDRNVYIFYDQTDKKRVVDQDDILHFPGLYFDGLRSSDPIRQVMRTSVELALSLAEYSNMFFRNGARPDIVLETDQPEAACQADMEVMARHWNARHQGIANWHRPAILFDGLKAKTLSANPEQTQLIEARKFQVEDLARFLGVPPFLIGHTEKSTSWGSGIGELGTAFVRYTLGQWLTIMQEEINRKLIRDSDVFCEYITAALEKTDLLSRYQAHRIGLGRAGEDAFLETDEVRRMENLPPMAS